MDGTSPGNMPSSLGEVWIGTTACAPNPQFVTPYEYPLTFAPAPTVACAPWQVSGVKVIGGGTTLQRVPETRLSEADVERIADRVIAKLRSAGLP